MDEEIKARLVIIIEKRGEQVADEELVSILKAIEEHGSLVRAARSVGIPYSRAWERISRAERILGERLVEAWKGGAGRGGTRLTRAAKLLVEAYNEAERSLGECLTMRTPRRGEAEDLIVAYSHDPIIELSLDKMRDEGYRVGKACMGSGLSLAMLSLSEADVACAHLYDPETGEYNMPYIRRYWIEEPFPLGGFLREIVLAYRSGLDYNSYEEIMEDIVRGELVVALRNRGSGTRVLFDHLASEATRRSGLSEPRVTAAPEVARTHYEAARMVALGKADASLLLRTAAEELGLRWVHVTWERYECYTTRGKLKARGVSGLARVLSSEWLLERVDSMPGYRRLEE